MLVDNSLWSKDDGEREFRGDVDDDVDADELMPSSIFFAPILSLHSCCCADSTLTWLIGLTIDDELLVNRSVGVAVLTCDAHCEDSIGDMLSMDEDELDVDGNDGVLLQFNIKLNWDFLFSNKLALVLISMLVSLVLVLVE